MKKCPQCAEDIQDEARVCRFCQHAQPPSQAERDAADAEARARNRRNAQFVAVLLIGILALVITAVVLSMYQPASVAEAQPNSRTLTYQVEGENTSSASVTYRNAEGGTEQQGDVTLPWHVAVDAHDGQFLYLSAQNKERGGCLYARILWGAVTVKESRSCGDFVIASVSARAEQ